ncbi:MAG TPA: PHB depolymerase family esterase [Ignavibacteria bacterium]|jgi:polyhydroxybutyrate depolymerase
MKSKILLFFIITLFTNISIAKNIEGKMFVDGIERFYIIHLPVVKASIEPFPVVLALHGGGGNAKQMMRYSKFNNTADREFFIVIYPEGYNKNWSDGRIGDELPMMRDDVKFISILLDTLKANYNIDTSRIFATGISNGGFFSIYLAYKLSNKILAVAPVCAAIPENLKNKFTLTNPVSMILINGTEDPLVKYDGGSVGFKGRDRGKSISTDETINIWVSQNGCNNTPLEEEMPDNDKKDKCKAVKYTYSGGTNGTEVILIKINGGGHAWPGRAQYLPKFIVGTVCKDFDGNDVVWDFFKRQKTRE